MFLIILFFLRAISTVTFVYPVRTGNIILLAAYLHSNKLLCPQMHPETECISCHHSTAKSQNRRERAKLLVHFFFSNKLKKKSQSWEQNDDRTMRAKEIAAAECKRISLTGCWFEKMKSFL